MYKLAGKWFPSRALVLYWFIWSLLVLWGQLGSFKWLTEVGKNKILKSNPSPPLEAACQTTIPLYVVKKKKNTYYC